MSQQPRTHGFTAIEVMIASTVMVILLTGVGQFFLQSSNAFSDVATRSHLTARTQVVMDRLVTELIAGRFVTMVPPVPDQSSWIRFDKPVDFVSGSPVYGNPFQIELVEVPGQSARAVRIWEDLPPYSTTPGVEDNPRILANNVAPGGLLFTRTGASLQIELNCWVTSGEGGTPETLRVISGVRMRNDS